MWSAITRHNRSFPWRRWLARKGKIYLSGCADVDGPCSLTTKWWWSRSIFNTTRGAGASWMQCKMRLEQRISLRRNINQENRHQRMVLDDPGLWIGWTQSSGGDGRDRKGWREGRFWRPNLQNGFADEFKSSLEVTMAAMEPESFELRLTVLHRACSHRSWFGVSGPFSQVVGGSSCSPYSNTGWRPEGKWKGWGFSPKRDSFFWGRLYIKQGLDRYFQNWTRKWNNFFLVREE